MELKKFLRSLGLSEQFITTKSRVFSGFGLGVIASVILLTVLFLNHPLKASLLYPVVQGFSSTKSPLVSWPFQFSSRNKTAQEGIFKEVSKNYSFTAFNDGNLVPNKSQSGNFTGNEKNITVMVVEKTYQGNLSRQVNSTNSSFVDRNKEKNVTDRGESGRSNNGTKGSVIESGHEQNLTKEHILTSSFNDSGIGNDDFEKCDIFDGRWVRDDKKPLYPAGSCPHIDRDFDCHLNGRPDEHFVKWRWQPNHCNIPSLNATDFLERLRGNRLVFVGDSLNRNMWESLVCILRHSVTDKKKVYEISGKKEFKKKGFYAFHYEDYNCSIDFVSSPFLVRESSTGSTNGLTETLRLDLMDRTAPMYHDAEIIVFNTGHWWTHEKTSKGENYYQEGKHVYPRLKVMEAYTKALTTWSRWIDSNVDVSKTQVFFRGYSVTHFRGGQWNSGGQCHKEFEPIYNDTYLAKYPAKMKALESVMRRMKTPVVYLNISKLSDYRKDAHPSIYRKEYKTLEEKIEAERSQDCSHWCLPGVPDTWNELLYASLLKIGRGSWRR